MRLGLFAMGVASLALAVPAQDFLPELVKRVKPSAVAIETFDARGNTLARGSGFFVSQDRVITNRHVIERSSRVEIHLLDGKKFPVRGVLAIDGEGDLALLQVDIPKTLAAPLPIVRAEPQEGESIVVIGNPFGLEGSVSNGIVSAVREISGYGKIIQITASISPGSSGSPVVNMAGQVIGVATLQAAEGQNLNFAVPAERISRLKVSSEAQSFSSLAAETQRSKRSAAERLYAQGLAQLSVDDYAKAVGFFEKAAETDPNYAEAWYQAGYSYGMLGRHADALKASKQAAKLRPDWAPAQVNIGASSYALGQYKEAGDAYKQAIRLDDTAETQYALGLTLGKLNRPDEEMLAYRRALALKPDHARAIEGLGLGLFKQRRFADSVIYLEQLKTYKPDARTFNYLGEGYFELGKLDESVGALTTALGYDPDLDKARYNLGRAYVKLGNRDMAQVQYEILKNSRSDWADRLYVLINP